MSSGKRGDASGQTDGHEGNWRFFPIMPTHIKYSCSRRGVFTREDFVILVARENLHW